MSNMDQSALSSYEHDDEIRALNALLDVFGSVCSLQEIANAYCTAGRDVNRTGAILSQLQESNSNGVVDESNDPINHDESSKALDAYDALETTLPSKSSRGKQKKSTASFGTVSSFMGKTYVRAAPSMNGRPGTRKPLKIDIKVPMVEKHELGKDSISDQDIEEFLFSMLGDGFKLSKDVIREVLGQCGYNVKDSMEELLALSEKALDKGKQIDHGTIEKDAGMNLETYSCTREIGSSCLPNERNSKEITCLEEDRSNSSREVLEALFCAPGNSDEEPERKHLEWGLNRTRVTAQKAVSKPPEDIPAASSIDMAKIRPNFRDVLDEDDKYHLLRRAAKQHWDTMKEYYEAAVDAFNKGDRAQANYLLEQGKQYNQLAREADEKSHLEIMETRNNEDQSDVPLDLHAYRSKEAVKLLKIHINYLAGIPSFRYLKVILDTDAEDTTRRKRRKAVIQALDQESIKWTNEEGNPGTILIKLDEIDLNKLSFREDLN